MSEKTASLDVDPQAANVQKRKERSEFLRNPATMQARQSVAMVAKLYGPKVDMLRACLPPDVANHLFDLVTAIEQWGIDEQTAVREGLRGRS